MWGERFHDFVLFVLAHSWARLCLNTEKKKKKSLPFHRTFILLTISCPVFAKQFVFTSQVEHFIQQTLDTSIRDGA